MRGQLNETEIECVRRLAKLFESGEPHWQDENDCEQLGLTSSTYPQTIATMEHIGVIDSVSNLGGKPYTRFRVTPLAVQMVREWAAEEERKKEVKDIVEMVKLTFRRHPFTAWAFIVFVVLGALITAANQLLSLLKSIGIIHVG